MSNIQDNTDPTDDNGPDYKENGMSTNGFVDFVNKHKKALIFGGLGVLLVIALIVGKLWFESWQKGIENDGQLQQERVEQLYKEAQVELSNCINQGLQSAQVASQAMDSVANALTEISSARYVDADGNATTASEALGGGSFFSMIQENYPELDISLFANTQSVVVGCSDRFANAQDHLNTEATRFEQWILDDSIFNGGAKDDFPSETLDVVDLSTNQVLTGQEALDYMTRVILVGQASDAYETGEQEIIDLFPDDEE